MLVLHNLYGSYGAYTGVSEHILVFRILYVYYRTYTYFTDTRVPLGAAGLILILPILEYP